MNSTFVDDFWKTMSKVIVNTEKHSNYSIFLIRAKDIGNVIAIIEMEWGVVNRSPRMHEYLSFVKQND